MATISPIQPNDPRGEAGWRSTINATITAIGETNQALTNSNTDLNNKINNTNTKIDNFANQVVGPKIGDIVSSQRIDFLTNSKYLPCGGQVVGSGYYPELANVMYKQIGQSWANLPNSAVRGITLVQNNRLLASSYPSVGTYYSDDNGANWGKIAEDTFGGFCLTATGRILATKEGGGIWYSDNNGANWNQSPGGGVGGGTIHAFALGINNRMLCSSYMLNTGYSTIYYSDDNGINWNAAGSKNFQGTIVKILKTTANSLVFCGTGAYRSTDNGINWKISSVSGSSTYNFYGVIQGNGSRLILGGSEGAFISDNDGESFSQTIKIWGGDVIKGYNGRILMSGTQTNPGIWYSDNNGSSWGQTYKTWGTTRTFSHGLNDRIFGVDASSASSFTIYTDPAAIVPAIPNFYIRAVN